MPLTVQYHFIQPFVVSAQRAFGWCTDFDPKDHALMGDAGVKRQILRISDATFILKDVFHSASGTVEKQKLVQLYPDKLTWTSTHLTGPNKHSQFLYEILPQGEGASVLKFTANHIEYKEKVDAQLLANQLCKEDAATWKLLAKAMADELRK